MQLVANHHTLPPLAIMQHYNFNSRAQKDGETVAQYVADLINQNWISSKTSSLHMLRRWRMPTPRFFRSPSVPMVHSVPRAGGKDSTYTAATNAGVMTLSTTVNLRTLSATFAPTRDTLARCVEARASKPWPHLANNAIA